MTPASGPIISGDAFLAWETLNDTIMGGQSSCHCRVSSEGLELDGVVVAEGGGFVSCRSPRFAPPLDLSRFQGIQLELSGDGRHYKLAIACADGVAGLTELIPGGVRWVHTFATEADIRQTISVRFDELIPSIRAKPVASLPLGVPLRFDPARISRLQLLHSRFGDDGQANPGFRSGRLHLTWHAILGLS